MRLLVLDGDFASMRKVPVFCINYKRSYGLL